MRSLLASSLLILGSGSWLEMPAKIEGWLFNARERTEQGLVAIEEGDAEAAAAALDTAARLAPRDPLARFNAGTGRLLAERQGATEELQQAAGLAGTDLLPRALYNLGNAQLQAEDPAAAVESFKGSLRLAPGQADAKHNLELALKALEQQQSSQDDGQETPESENQGDQERSSAAGSEDPPEDDESQPEGEESSEQPNSQGQPEPDENQQRPLLNFEDQPDMTAEQAAAILEAVENLERELRQHQAAERLKRRKKGERDW
ncbi:MAG: tetratricopeptide repeat protein [Acidobacteria bacterium]|nr:tetratricopeptide repeat protein [Acidobacteriota bacterium]